jgi:monoamine oxidase
MTHSLLFRKLIYALQEARRLNLQSNGQPLPISKSLISKSLISKSSRHWTRRRFVRNLTLAGGAALTSGSLPSVQRALSQGKMPAIAIVGGGIAGLNAAYQLKKAGLKATVYEASNRIGGRIQSLTGAIGEGLVTDLGGSLINTDHADMLALAKEFNLKLFSRAEDVKQLKFPGTAYFFENRMRSEEEVAENLRPLALQIAKDSALLDQDYEKFAPEFDRLSVKQYLDRHADKFLAPFIRTLVENTLRTEYGVEADSASALLVIGILPVVKGQSVDLLSYSDEVFSVQGGSGQIIERLASALKGQIQTQNRLIKLQAKGKGYRLTFANQAVVDADYVIISIPFTLLRAVELQVVLPPTLSKFIQEGDLGANDKLFAGFSQKVWRKPNGFVGEIWTDLGFAEAWDETERQTNRKDGALNFFLGGNQVKILESGSVQTVGKQFLSRFEAAIPGAQAAATGRFLRTQWTQNPFSKGAYSTFSPGQLTAFRKFFYIESDKPSERQDVAVGNLIFAGEHLSDEFYGFMNGGAQTGRLAAQVVMSRIRQRKL